MAYINNRKVFTAIRVDKVAECPPSYDGDYTITENGVYKTGGKKMDSDLTVNVASSSKNTLKTLLDATKSCNYLFANYQGESVDNLISYEDTSNVTNVEYMFYRCFYVKSIPSFDTSNVTSMAYMFEYCQTIKSIPSFDTSNVTAMPHIFYFCTDLESIPLLSTSKVTNFYSAFYNCYSLISIPSLDASNATSFGDAFYNCKQLTAIHMTGMKASFDISYSTNLTREALLEIINNCQDLTGKTSKRITMGSTNLAKLTDEDKLIATNKNWTLA